MANNGFRDAFCLLGWRMQILGKEVKRKHAAVELKGHFRRRDVLVSRANVVEEAG